jgi:GNAT superfamily N-acetyltransferase
MSSHPFRVRPIQQGDFFWLKSYDCAPLTIERDSIYLFFCVHFREYSFVAADFSDVPIGFVLGFLPAGSTSAYVHFLFVRDNFRRKGVGTRLMTEFMHAAARNGAKSVLLYTIRARSFYKSIGFSDGADLFEEPVTQYIIAHKGAQPMSRSL